jgi:hypothetical protein
MSNGRPIELDLDEIFLVHAADQTARALGLAWSWEKTDNGIIIGMSKKKGSKDPKPKKKPTTRRGGKGGGDGLNISRRTPYLT